MRIEHIKQFACPKCKQKLGNLEKSGDFDGVLPCLSCKNLYQVIDGIPRFVDPEHYSSSFGFQWNIHATTQYDSKSGHNISEKRLFRESKWPKDMKGDTVLEVGCGSGRFTEQLAKTGATVFAVDASNAVEVNHKQHENHENVCVAQADLNHLPFQSRSFDRVLCIGVLQHTPDPFQSFKNIVEMVRVGGVIVSDVYDKQPIYKRILNTRHWVRPLTKRLPPAFLYKAVRGYVFLMWPLVKLIHKLPYGVKINNKLLIAEHLSYTKLSPEMQKEWTILDTFDWLSPEYENTQDIERVKEWCAQLPLKDIEVEYGYGGIEIRATRA